MTTDQERDGWWNFCEACRRAGRPWPECRYWVRNVDAGQTKVRRFIDRESGERHTCIGVAAEAA